jgi:hypothetical protein
MDLKKYMFVSLIGFSSGVSSNLDNHLSFNVEEPCAFEDQSLDSKLLDFDVLGRKDISLELGSINQLIVANILNERIKNYGEIIEYVVSLNSCRLDNNIKNYTPEFGDNLLEIYSSDLTQRYIDDKYKLGLIESNIYLSQ